MNDYIERDAVLSEILQYADFKAPEYMKEWANKLKAAICQDLFSADDWYKEACDYKAALSSWIPVTERLPEEAGRYLVFLKASADERNRWKEYGWEGDPSYVIEALYNSRQKLWETETFAYNAVLSEVDMENDDAVTHWMPLPERPKEETE